MFEIDKSRCSILFLPNPGPAPLHPSPNFMMTDHDYPMDTPEKVAILQSLDLLDEHDALEQRLAVLSQAENARLKWIKLSVYLRGRFDVKELQLQILEEYFRSTLVDITRLSTRKVPEWIADVDVSPTVGSLTLWKTYWRYAHLYIPGEAWIRLPTLRLTKSWRHKHHQQPWRTSLTRMLRFADRLFCYPEDSPEDPLLDDARHFPHPARLRDYVRTPRAPESLMNDRPSIEFEVLFPFQIYYGDGGDDDDIFRPSMPRSHAVYTFRALLWLFDMLECHRPENRHRLVISLKWKDTRVDDPVTGAPSLEWEGHPENIYAIDDPATKAIIPDGLGIKEKYMQVINEGLEIWSAFLKEEKRLLRLRNQRWKELQEENARTGKEVVQTEDEEVIQLGPGDFPNIDHEEKTTRLGINAARANINVNNFVNHLAHQIRQNIDLRIFKPNDEHQMAYVAFWQRVSLNIPPLLIVNPYWNVSDEFVDYIEELTDSTHNFMFDFAGDPKGFLERWNVVPRPDVFFREPINCSWQLDDPVNNVGVELRHPEDQDSERG